MIFKQYPKTFVCLVLLVVAVAVSYRWTVTPHGKLDYRAALSLHLLSFTPTMQPDPDVDFEMPIPVNLIFTLSGLLPSAQMARVQDVTIPGPDGDIPARVYWPYSDRQTGNPPVLVYYHGGGFVVGSVDIFDPLARSLAQASGAIVISVDYRLAPAHPYPAAVNDAYAALQWASREATRLGGDPQKLVVAGDSAGGNLAAVVALKARNERGPAPAAQILYYPGTDLTDKTWPSAEKFGEDYGLPRESMRGFREAYLGHVDDRSDPYVSPLYADSLSGLPPALVVTAGFDPLTSSAQAYVRRLQRANVAVTHRHYPEMIHGFMSVALFPQQQQALKATDAFLQRALYPPR